MPTPENQVVSDDDEFNSNYSCEDCSHFLTRNEVAYYESNFYADCLCFDCRNNRFDNEGDNDDSSDNRIQSHVNANGNINSYGYKPDALMHGDDGLIKPQQKNPKGFEPYFGIEIEIERKESSIYRDVAAKKVGELCKQLVYIKEDCSLNDGFEIVTHPMTLGYVQNHTDGLWEALMYLRRAGYRSWTT